MYFMGGLKFRDTSCVRRLEQFFEIIQSSHGENEF